MTSKTEKRTQVYLTADQHRRATRLARRKGTSLAGVVREALDRYLRMEESGDEAPWEEDPLLSLLGALELEGRGEEELDERIDRSLYDEV